VRNYRGSKKGCIELENCLTSTGTGEGMLQKALTMKKDHKDVRIEILVCRRKLETENVSLKPNKSSKRLEPIEIPGILLALSGYTKEF